MKRFALIVIAAVYTGGCALTATLIPVEGPLSELRPVPVVKVRADGILGDDGKITFVLPPEDKCAGRWATASAGSVAFGAASLMSEYGTKYISGYSVSGSGRTPGRAIATCDSGRIVDLEFVSGTSAHGFGIGKDNAGNIYRFVF